MAACGKGERGGPAEAGGPAPAPVTRDSAPAEPDEAAPAALPADFPDDFPIPPDASVVRATTRSDRGGTAAAVALVTEGTADDTFRWIVDGLSAAGWEVTDRSGGPEGRTIHAIQGESYADVTVLPPRAGTGARVEVRLWKARP